MSKRVLVLTDSLALPREKPEFCGYEETWPQKLKEEGYVIHQVSIGGGLIGDLVRQAVGYHKMFNPDIIILQAGIVDCVPRFASKFELEFWRRIPFLGKKVLNFKSKKKVRKKAYTSISQFEYSLKRLKKAYSGTQIYVVEIAPASLEYETLLKGVTQRINDYNNVIRMVFGKNVIRMTEVPSEGIMSDFHHLNAIGHDFIFQSLLKTL